MPLDDTISTGQAGHITDHQTIAAQLNTLTGPHAAATTDVFTAKVTGDTVDRFVVNADGKIEWGPGNGALDTNLYRSAANTLTTDDSLQVLSPAAGSIVLTVKGAASQTAKLQEWQNSAATLQASVDVDGIGSFNYVRAGGPNVGLIDFNALRAHSIAAGSTVTVIKGAASQTANLTEWQNSAGTVLLSVAAAGHLTFPAATNIILDTVTGTKIGTATTEKLGFWNATPVVRPTAVADATGGVTVDTEARAALNALLSRMRTIGLIAT